MDGLLFIDPQADDFQFIIMPAQKMNGLLYMLLLFIRRSLIAGAVVMADNGDAHRLMIISRYGQPIEDGGYCPVVCAISQDQIRTGFSDRVYIFGVETFLQVSNDRNLDAAVHAGNGSTEL